MAIDLRLVYTLSLLGAKETQLAEALRISESLVKKRMQVDAAFRKAVLDGRAIADSKVAESLYKRATGYDYVETLVTVRKNSEGEVTVIETPVKKHIPPDVVACIFWLKNRQKDQWADVNRMDVRAQAAVISANIDLSQLSDEQLQMAKAIGFNLRRQAQIAGSNGGGKDAS